MITFFHEISWSLDVLIIAIASFILSLLLTLLFRRLYLLYGYAIDKELHMETINISALILGLLLGFAVLVSQNWYDAAEETIANQAASIQNSLRNANVFDHTNKRKIQESFKEYIQYLLDHWKDLVANKEETTTEEYINNIQIIYSQIPINTNKENIAYSNALQDLNSINQQRFHLERLSSANLHPIVWNLILFFSIILLIFIITYPVKNKIYHYLSIYLYTFIISIFLLFLNQLEYPFSGEIHVSPKDLKSILSNMLQEDVNS